MTAHLLGMFDSIRIINLPERTDRRREVEAQIDRIGGFTDRIAFHPACRPADAGPFPSIGARGCFMSHLDVLRAAQAADVERLLILEDDLDFSADVMTRGPILLDALAASDWNLFYGAYGADGIASRPEAGLARIAPTVGVETLAFIAVEKRTIGPLVAFLEAMLGRPPGSPDYGPMHVDGAYGVFRASHPDHITFAAVPPLGIQRSSRSDITPGGMLLDRFAATHGIANRIRRLRDSLKGL